MLWPRKLELRYWKSTPATVLFVRPVGSPLVKMIPTLDCEKIGWVMRTTDNACPSVVGVGFVMTLSAPMPKPPYSPDNLPPARIVTGTPCTRPMLREKNGLPLLELRSL